MNNADNMYELTAGIKGEYLLYVVNPDGSHAYPIGEEFHKNIITDIGLDRLLSFTGMEQYGGSMETLFRGGCTSHCRLGSGATAAAATDTALQSQHANPAPTNTIFTGPGANTTTSTDATITGVVTHQKTFEFAAAGSTVSVNEVGVGWTESTASTLFSRFVLPATFSLVAGQILRVVWRWSISIPQFVTGTNTNLVSGAFDATGTAPTRGLKVTGTVASLFGLLRVDGSSGPDTGVGSIFGIMSCNPGSFPWGQIHYCNLSSNAGHYPAVGTVLPMTSLVQHATTFTRNYVGAGAGVSPKYLDRVFEFTPAQPAGTVADVNAFVFSEQSNTGPVPRAAISILFDNPQTKANTHRLRFGIRTSWARL